MIKLDGHFTYTFSIGDSTGTNIKVKDFISVNNLNSFVLFLAMGNRRPIMHLNFRLDNTEIIKYLNAGNILTVSFGKDEPSMETMQFELYGDSTDKNFSIGYDIEIRGAFYKHKLTSLINTEYFGKTTSLKVLQKIADDNNMNLVTNITKTNDLQEWHRNGVTQWQYMKEVWLHSYINDKTFMTFGFDDTNIYFYDMRTLCTSDSKWVLSTNKTAGRNSNIVPIGYYFTKNLYGSLADLVGKNLSLGTYNVDTGVYVEDSYALKNFTSLDTDKININATNSNDFSYSIITGDVHANYVKAYNQNLRNNIMYSSFSIYAPSGGQFKKVKLGDTVTFDVNPKDKRLDGLAFITEICYQYTNGRFNINLTLNKEAPSGMKGDELETGD